MSPRALRNCAPSAPTAGASVRPLNFTVRPAEPKPSRDNTVSASAALNVDSAIKAGVVLNAPYGGDAWWLGLALFLTFLFVVQLRGFARRRKSGHPVERQTLIGAILFWLLFLGAIALAMLQHHGVL